MSKMPDDYQVPDDPDTGRMDAEFLRTCLGLRTEPGEDPPELPLAVRRAHYDMAHSLSRLGASGNGMDPTQLATVVLVAMRDGAKVEAPETPAYSFLDQPLPEHGEKVVITWRNKERAAHFLRVHDGKVVVLHDGEEKNIRPDLVRMPEGNEFPDVAASVH